MPGSPRFLLACLLSACALTVAACGDEDPITAPPPAAPAAEAADFPKAATGATLADLSEGIPEGPILAPSVSVLEKGDNRVAFALFDRARKQIAGASLAIYTARPDGTGLRGPYVARNESLEVKPQFRSQTTSQDPDAATAIYVADVPFKRNGDVVVARLAKIDGRLMATEPAAMRVGSKGATPPNVGDKAISVSTPTVASVAGNVESIDTRVPPAPQLHQEDFAKVLGKKPAVLLFATPQLCQSKVCGPVVTSPHRSSRPLPRTWRSSTWRSTTTTTSPRAPARRSTPTSSPRSPGPSSWTARARSRPASRAPSPRRSSSAPSTRSPSRRRVGSGAARR
jgi:hypothetical protein